MPSYKCQVCATEFSIPQPALDKFPNWEPKYCREHSPVKKPGGKGAGSKPSRARGGGGRGGGSRRPKEENLTCREVLARYEGGPQSGVFTDGSSIPNPGPGGWGVVWVENGEVREARHGHDDATTNNRMELMALIEALRLLPESASVTVYSDSRLCIDTIGKWAPNWEKKGWKKKGGEIKNLELVKELLALSRAHPNCRLEWIAAHSGNLWNEYADSLSTAWMRSEV